MGLLCLQQEARLREDVWTTGKGETQWEIRVVRKIRKKDGNRTPKNKNKNQKVSSISSPKESLDGNYDTEICKTVFSVSSAKTTPAMSIKTKISYKAALLSARIRLS